MTDIEQRLNRALNALALELPSEVHGSVSLYIKALFRGQREAMVADTKLLDFLEAENQKHRYTGRCIYRLSTTGRGWRLHETSEDGAYETVREAIAAGIAAEDDSWHDLEDCAARVS